MQGVVRLCTVAQAALWETWGFLCTPDPLDQNLHANVIPQGLVHEASMGSVGLQPRASTDGLLRHPTPLLGARGLIPSAS